MRAELKMTKKKVTKVRQHLRTTTRKQGDVYVVQIPHRFDKAFNYVLKAFKAKRLN